MSTQVLAAHPDAEVEVLVVWGEILPSDNQQAAEAMAATLDDPRVRHFWDADMSVGRLLSDQLSVGSRYAWDIYVVYGPRELWTNEPPQPLTWAHQMDGVPDHYRKGAALDAFLDDVMAGLQPELDL